MASESKGAGQIRPTHGKGALKKIRRGGSSPHGGEVPFKLKRASAVLAHRTTTLRTESSPREKNKGPLPAAGDKGRYNRRYLRRSPIRRGPKSKKRRIIS